MATISKPKLTKEKVREQERPIQNHETRQRPICSTYNPFCRQYSASSASAIPSVSTTIANLSCALQSSGLLPSPGTARPDERRGWLPLHAR